MFFTAGQVKAYLKKVSRRAAVAQRQAFLPFLFTPVK
jgi:hypothetical protein